MPKVSRGKYLLDGIILYRETPFSGKLFSFRCSRSCNQVGQTKQGIGEHIEVWTTLLTDPTGGESPDQWGGSEFIFTSKEMTEPGTLTPDSINLKK